MAEEGPAAVQRWLQVLKAGGTLKPLKPLKPLELLQLAGIDLSLHAPVRAAVAYADALVDELERAFPI